MDKFKESSQKTEQIFGGGVLDNNNQAVLRENEWCKRKIDLMINDIDDLWILKAIIDFISGMTKEGG